MREIGEQEKQRDGDGTEGERYRYRYIRMPYSKYCSGKNKKLNSRSVTPSVCLWTKKTSTRKN
jgi:hypothetical protein